VDSIPDEFWRVVTDNFIKRYDFLIMDTAHDFSDLTITMLNASTYILLLLTPEMAALRAAVSALNIYERLGFPEEKIKIILNNPIPTTSIKQSQLEKALKRPIDMVIPYEPIEVLRGINFGQPFYAEKPELAISSTLENLAYELSSEIHKNIPPPAPSLAWKRVTGRPAQKT
jgi:pilus assembly protein CpaE